jgi:ComF family protein
MNNLWLNQLTNLSCSCVMGIRQLIYPDCCVFCGTLLTENRHFCASCRDAINADSSLCCPRCAGSVGAFAVVDGCCPACRLERFAFEQVIRLGRYDGLLRDVVLRLKNQRGEGLAELIGEHWAEQAAERFRPLGLDAIVPVPLHWLRRWQRGYNQSAGLCRGLSSILNLPCQSNWLRRIRSTPRQTSQTAAARKANVRGAFRTRPGATLRGRAILLVDDVMTTGATAHEAARAVLEGGARRVVVAVLARAQG